MDNMHSYYINKMLIPEILTNLNEKFVSCKIEYSGGLDGFMSTLYNLCLKTQAADGPKEHLLMVKLMKGDDEFRESSKSYTQFANEVYIYAKVLPEFKNILKASKLDISVENWVPHAYVARFGYIEGLSAGTTERESVLVLENLKPRGFVLGPRVYLNRDELISMSRPLGQYHALSYAMKIQNKSLFKKLTSGIVPLPFINDNDPYDAQNNLYRSLYRVAFDRFYDFFDRKFDELFDEENESDVILIKNLQFLRDKYFTEPTRLLEHIRTKALERDEDKTFAAILHGDFNRNNVLFQYNECEDDSSDIDAEVEAAKLIDFQEVRYSTPAIDLSFFMFINTPEATRYELWFDILMEYHAQMLSTLSRILKANVAGDKSAQDIDNILNKYSFQKFYAHFARYAIYGVMICMHFLPWLLCTEDECTVLSKLFETDMHSKEFHKISMEAGGDKANMSLFEIMKLASRLGYFNNL